MPEKPNLNGAHILPMLVKIQRPLSEVTNEAGLVELLIYNESRTLNLIHPVQEIIADQIFLPNQYKTFALVVIHDDGLFDIKDFLAVEDWPKW